MILNSDQKSAVEICQQKESIAATAIFLPVLQPGNCDMFAVESTDSNIWSRIDAFKQHHFKGQ